MSRGYAIPKCITEKRKYYEDKLAFMKLHNKKNKNVYQREIEKIEKILRYIDDRVEFRENIHIMEDPDKWVKV